LWSGAARRTARRQANSQDTPVSLSRFAWLLTVIACLITAGAMLLEHYRGYPALALVVGIAAAINLL
jgi:ABC-type xylose transport system permease subunit